MPMVVGMAIDAHGDRHGDGARELIIVHTVVLHLVDHELQVHEGITTALTSTLGLAMAVHKGDRCGRNH